VAQELQHLCNKHKTLHSNLSTSKRKKRKGQFRQGTWEPWAGAWVGEEQRDFEVTHGTPPPRSSLASPMTLVVLPMPLGKNTATLPLPALLACLAECWPGHSIQVWPQGTRG
jgi:hypothetical protein